MFIVIEGIDGSGKTTLSEIISRYFDNRNIVYKLIKPYDLNKQNHKDYLDLCRDNKLPGIAMAPLFAMMMYEILRDKVIPAILEGKVVITDRWFYSTIAYQQYGYDVDEKIIDSLYEKYLNIDEILATDFRHIAKHYRNQIRNTLENKILFYMKPNNRETIISRIKNRDLAENNKLDNTSTTIYYDRILNGYDAIIQKDYLHGIQKTIIVECELELKEMEFQVNNRLDQLNL